MKCLYFRGTGEKLYLDGYERSDIKLSCFKIKGLITSAVQQMRIVKIIFGYFEHHGKGGGNRPRLAL
jgi:hypothetical protein